MPSRWKTGRASRARSFWWKTGRASRGRSFRWKTGRASRGRSFRWKTGRASRARSFRWKTVRRKTRRREDREEEDREEEDREEGRQAEPVRSVASGGRQGGGGQGGGRQGRGRTGRRKTGRRETGRREDRRGRATGRQGGRANLPLEAGDWGDRDAARIFHRKLPYDRKELRPEGKREKISTMRGMGRAERAPEAGEAAPPRESYTGSFRNTGRRSDGKGRGSRFRRGEGWGGRREREKRKTLRKGDDFVARKVSRARAAID